MSAGGAPGRAVTGWADLARQASVAPLQQEAAALLEFVSFRVEGAPYAIGIDCVREIVRVRNITTVPRVPSEVRGVISLRGEIVQVVDLRLRLGMEAAEPTRTSRIVVVHGGAGEVAGLLVDEVTEVLRVEHRGLRPPLGGESDCVGFLCERDGDFVSVLNLERVMDFDRG